MLLRHLREEVLQANLELIRRGLVIYTFGNASGIDRDLGLVVIKPSGVPFDELVPENLVVTDLEGRVLEGDLRPSSDLPTHLALYRAFPSIGGVVHTHSRYATAWAQAHREIPCLGTTHADYFHGAVPVTEPLSREEIEKDYERHTGEVIVRRFRDMDPLEMPAVLVAGHGPFCWGRSAAEAAEHAVLLEEVAALAYFTAVLNPAAGPLAPALLDKHFYRKHGAGAYYGQKSK
ncbi:MAG TPA: L-ribulose-5-phosphate 4-epimerase [Bryobacteraceae bacterium]|nr:L-ribulose-5-phosphate 4-epimerase [Bryobacteraceae bacterium]